MTNKEMLQQIMNTMGTINQRLDGIEQRVTALESPKKPTVTVTGSAKPQVVKDVPFTKHDGTVVMATQAQVNAWTKRRENYVPKEDRLAKWSEDRANFKPSQTLIDAIKAKPTMTRKEAKELGFVGTSDDLWNFKYGKNGVIKQGEDR